MEVEVLRIQAGNVAAVSGTVVGVASRGIRKGSAPLGEAWLLDATEVKGMPAMRRYVCHFRQLGL